MTPINEVPVGKFVRLAGNVVYVIKNNFKDNYALIPIEGHVSKDEAWDVKVYVYKRLNKQWIERAKESLKDSSLHKSPIVDNLTYIENLNILRNYLKPVIVSKEK
jgi:hypothetical protein